MFVALKKNINTTLAVTKYCGKWCLYWSRGLVHVNDATLRLLMKYVTPQRMSYLFSPLISLQASVITAIQTYTHVVLKWVKHQINSNNMNIFFSLVFEYLLGRNHSDYTPVVIHLIDSRQLKLQTRLTRITIWDTVHVLWSNATCNIGSTAPFLIKWYLHIGPMGSIILLKNTQSLIYVNM